MFAHQFLQQATKSNFLQHRIDQRRHQEQPGLAQRPVQAQGRIEQVVQDQPAGGPRQQRDIEQVIRCRRGYRFQAGQLCFSCWTISGSRSKPTGQFGLMEMPIPLPVRSSTQLNSASRPPS